VSERVARDFRRQAAKVAADTVQKVAPAIQAALGNEQRTRQRVEWLESRAAFLTSRTDTLDALASAGFLARLRWLFLGNLPKTVDATPDPVLQARSMSEA
jgi:hypothetical protein